MSQSGNTIGIITNDAHQVFQAQVIEGIRHAVDGSDYTLQIFNTGAPEAALNRAQVQPDILAGVLVIANALNEAALADLVAAGKPVSLISHQSSTLRIPAVIADNAGGIAQLLDYLVAQRGRRRIAFITGDLSQNDGIERSQAFVDGLMRHHLPIEPERFLAGEFKSDIAADSLERYLAANPDVDALAAADYLMAVAAMRVLERHQIAVPEQVAVVGFGDGAEAAAAGLTTVGVDVERIGWHAGRQVLGQIGGADIQGVTVLGTTIVERGST